MISKIKFKKFYLIGLIQLIIQIVCFAWGICFESSSYVMPANFLGMLTKIQITNSFQNFVWCFTNNISVLFIVFWISYWTFGIVGTFWCATSAFRLGLMVRLSVLISSWISICFMLLELIASIIAMLASTYFIFEKQSKKNYIYDENKYKVEKKSREKRILLTLIVIASISLIAAILETIALSLLQ